MSPYERENTVTVTRRSVLIAGTAAPVALAGTSDAWTAEETALRARPATGGRTVPLRDGWRFALVDPAGLTDPTGAYARAAEPDYDDSAWRRIAVPHDWSIELSPTTDHGTTSGTGFFPGGLGWYRIAFTLPKAYADKQVSIEFDGVYMDSSVHCNGQLVGQHPYGYTGFALDLTDLLHTDGTTPNVIAVEVRNRLPSSRWYSGSGIHREARLVVTDPVHVQRWGTQVTTPDIRKDRALVRARTSVVNASGDARRAEVRSTVVDPDGHTVARGTSTVTVGADPATVTHDLTVRGPRMWDIDTPTLYTLKTELRVDGRTVDTYETPSASATSPSTPTTA